MNSVRQNTTSGIGSLIDACRSTGIKLCILHGHEDVESLLRSDIDCVVPKDTLPGKLARSLVRNGVFLVQHRHYGAGHQFVICSRGGERTINFTIVDAVEKYCSAWAVCYPPGEILVHASEAADYWIPAPPVEFVAYLIKKLGKGGVTDRHSGYLRGLYISSPIDCENELRQFWDPVLIRLIVDACSGGEWDEVNRKVDALLRRMRRRAFARNPFDTVAYAFSEIRRLPLRWWAPNGLHVVLLGADGSGKSTVLARVREDLSPAFRHASTHHLAPRLFRRAMPGGMVLNPHGKPPRSPMSALLKCLYWLFDYSAGYYIRIRPKLVRSTLVLFDRYLCDVIVDPKRYRYGGPEWLLRVVWKLVPKPDLVILLDAPAEVLQSRKQEVPFEETSRQRTAYLTLVDSLPRGHIVDASQPLDKVVEDVNRTILDFMARRTAQRLGVGLAW